MTPNELRSALAELGITQVQGAKLVGVSVRSMHAYSTGRKIPMPVAKLLRSHVELGKAQPAEPSRAMTPC
jgi:DNA-binding XRE family transcriptional regulator